MKTKWIYVIPFLVLAYLLTAFSDGATENKPNGTFVIVLDAGHGGHDPGNLGNGYLEKNIALNIVLKIGAILEEDPNISVIYTRKDDTFVDLYARGEIANKAKADLFVSVHCDSHTSDAQGAGTFVLGLHANKQNFEIAKKENSAIYLEDNYETRYAEYDINSPESVIGLTIMQEEFLDQSIALAKEIQDNFSNKLKRVDRKVKQAGFIVLHQTFMPSVLVETGFLTNKIEGVYLNSKGGQLEMGTAIAEAILDYKRTLVGVAETKDNAHGTSKEIAIENKPIEKAVTQKNTVKKGETSKSMPKPTTVVTKEKGPKNKKAGKKTGTAISGSTSKPAISEKKKEVIIKTPTKKEVVVAKKLPKNTTSIIFKVQIFASSRDLSLESDNFKGLNKLSKEHHKNLYKYLYGSTNSYFQAKLLKSNADIKGFTTSYIVAYKDGKRILLSEALKYVKE